MLTRIMSNGKTTFDNLIIAKLTRDLNGIPIQFVCSLARIEHDRSVVEPRRGEAETFERYGFLGICTGLLERGERCAPLAAAQRIVATGDQIIARWIGRGGG